ncbi:MAG: MBL fold metallo-hydrolase [Bacteroidales bacterium]
MAKIITLLDNFVATTQLQGEHGISLYIEEGGEKILFDTGQSALFAQNANHLGVDLSLVDKVVISHGHYDHTGGIARFLELNDRATIYMRKEALWPKFNGDKYIGIPHSTLSLIEGQKERFKLIEAGVTHLSNSFSLLSTPCRPLPAMRHFFVEREAKREPDLFCDEQYLLYKGAESNTLFTGCSHKGVVAIVEDCKSLIGQEIGTVIGGLHTMGASKEALEVLIKELKESGLQQIVTGHCTGIEPYVYLKRRMGAKIGYSHTGDSFNLLQ